MKKVSFSIQLFVCLIVFAATVCAANDGTIHGRITEVRGYLMHDLTVTARNNYDQSVRYPLNGFRVARDLD